MWKHIVLTFVLVSGTLAVHNLEQIICGKDDCNSTAIQNGTEAKPLVEIINTQTLELQPLESQPEKDILIELPKESPGNHENVNNSQSSGGVNMKEPSSNLQTDSDTKLGTTTQGIFEEMFIPAPTQEPTLDGEIPVPPAEPPKVTLPNGGILVGTIMQSVIKKTLKAFRGIPYAKPPLGKLRFMPPEPAPGWVGEKLANEDAPPCPQSDPFQPNNIAFGNEDCLYLNVYTPENYTSNGSLPVMVFFHGGAFHFGSSNSDLYGPQRLLDYEVILVTSNYRLGPLGFLSTGTLDCPGNNGLKDQVQVLKWVGENIGAFGGSPDKVTIFGQSAGAASVTYHLISKKAEGFFQKAIIQSGTNFDCWSLVQNKTAIYRAKKLSNLLKCNSTFDWPKVLDCLRTKSATEIVSTLPAFYSFGRDPIVAFGPVVEPEHEEAYLINSPRDIVAPHGLTVPIMIGVTAEEGVLKSGRRKNPIRPYSYLVIVFFSLFLTAILHNFAQLFKTKFRKVLPKFLYYDDRPKSIRKNITTIVERYYFNRSHTWTKENHHNLTNLFSDRLFYSGMDQYLRNRFGQKNTTLGHTFIYLFDHKGPITASVGYVSGPEYYGVVHGDELPYLFPMNATHVAPIDNDLRIKWALPRMWTHFASVGNPTPAGSHIRQWKPAKQLNFRYAHIGSKNTKDMTILRNERGFMGGRMKFWRTIQSRFLN